MVIVPHYVFLGSFLCALFLLQWRVQESYPVFTWLLLALAAVCGLFARRRGGFFVILTAAGMALALACIMRIAAIPRPITQHANGSLVTLEGTIAALPDDRQIRVQHVLAVRRLRAGTGAWTNVRDRVLLTDRAMATSPLPGDAVRVTGKLETPKDTEDFSYAEYLGLRRIHAVMNVRGIEPVACTPERRIERMLAVARARLEERIAAVFPEPASALLSGLLTGRDDDLPYRVLEDFRRTGMSHLTAVSGSNITIVLSVLGGMLFFLPLRWRFIPCVIGVVLFTLFTGAGASVVRAAITGILGLIALQSGRIAHARLTVLWAASFMLAWNPAQLWADMGFQLSFLAVIGITELRPLLEPLTSRVPAVFGLREALQTTLSAQLTAMPWAAARFGILSLVSPLSNLIVAPLIPLAMTAGFVGTLVGTVSASVGRLIGLPALLALEGVLGIARLTADLPYAAVELPLPLSIIGLYYLGLAGGATIMSRKSIQTTEYIRT